MKATTPNTHPIVPKLKLACEITLGDFLEETGQTTEDLDKQYLEWRLAIDYPKYSVLSESIDEFVDRLVEDEVQNGTRIIPNGYFIINIEGKTHPGPFWSTIINRGVFYTLNDPRLSVGK